MDYATNAGVMLIYTFDNGRYIYQGEINYQKELGLPRGDWIDQKEIDFFTKA